jgi:hypothetical protein
MPFDAAFDDIYKFGIKEPASELGVLAERVDEQIFSEGILDRIYRQIDVADIVIADMTGQNANVFYEVGYAHAKEKLCILLTSRSGDIPFDLKHRRHIVYDGSIKNLKNQLKKDIEWAKNEITNVRNSLIKVDFKSISGYLDKDDYSATADIDFRIRLSNDNVKSTPEIEAIYFYTGNNWSINQEGRPCVSMESDIDKFKMRHLVSLPVKKITSKSWTDLTFNTKRPVAFSFRGEELKSSYKVSGKTILRIVTSNGIYDYPHFVDIVAEEIPF